MSLTRQHQEFNYYCLDRSKPLTEEIKLTYNDGNIIRKVLYKVGLKATIKHTECFILYTESDEDLDKLFTEPYNVYSYAYDIVINGYEAGGGSLRIYDQDVQEKIFKVLGFTQEDIQNKFGFFVESLKYGTPPHGGFALGLDRLSMILSGTDNIRDVIAFPKNLAATDPVTNAPYEVDPEQLDNLGICIKKED